MLNEFLEILKASIRVKQANEVSIIIIKVFLKLKSFFYKYLYTIRLIMYQKLIIINFWITLKLNASIKPAMIWTDN